MLFLILHFIRLADQASEVIAVVSVNKHMYLKHWTKRSIQWTENVLITVYSIFSPASCRCLYKLIKLQSTRNCILAKCLIHWNRTNIIVKTQKVFIIAWIGLSLASVHISWSSFRTNTSIPISFPYIKTGLFEQ